MKICCVGSSNIDMCAHVERLPRPGETMGNGEFLQSYGGKGANQAIAAARLGCQVSFLTAVGNDIYGTQMIRHYADEGMDITGVMKVNDVPSGIALIMIDKHGENCISACPGANWAFPKELVIKNKQLIEEADILLLQAEAPYPVVKEAIETAHRAGKKVVFNLAPVCKVEDSLFPMVDVLIVNETEGSEVSGLDADYKTIAQALKEKGVGTVIITLGSKGCYALTNEGGFFVPAFKVKSVDAVGAGDTFCGAVTVALAEMGTISPEALRFGCASSALSVMGKGAQTSIPQRDMVEEFLAAHANE